MSARTPPQGYVATALGAAALALVIATLVAGNNSFTGTNSFTGPHTTISNLGIVNGQINYTNYNHISTVPSTGGNLTAKNETNQWSGANSFPTASKFFLQDSNDATKQLVYNLHPVTTAHNVNETIPNINGTVMLSTSALNSTTGQLSGNGTGTSSTTLVMDGVYATLTPNDSGRVTVSVTGGEASGTTGDGCQIGIRESTSSMGANGAALAGTLLGGNLHLTTAVGGDKTGFARVYDFAGTAGTKYYFDLSFAAITGGTCTIIDTNWNLVEH